MLHPRRVTISSKKPLMRQRSASVEILPGPREVALAAARLFAGRARDACHQRGEFTCVLSGGSTPRGLYELLGRQAANPTDPVAASLPWDRIHLFWGDERFVPPDHPDSNYRMVAEALLDRVSLPAGHVHRVPTDAGSAAAAAWAYEQEIRDFFTARRLLADGLPRFDLALLGMGPDGHTASLFPGSPVLHERNRIACAVRVEGTRIPERITLTPAVFNAARGVVFLATGAEKSETLRAVIEGPRQPARLPCQAIVPDEGDLLWLVDAAAASQLADA